jgi:hypothetical protein
MANIAKVIEETIKKTILEYKDALATNVSGDAMYKIMKDLDEGAHNVAKSFGQGREAIAGLKVAMGEAVTSVELLGGEFANIVEIQKEVGNTLGRNILLNSDAYAKLFAAQEVSGQKAQDIVSAFKDAGISAYNASKQMQTVIDSAREIGVNAKLVSDQVLKNTESMNKYNFVGGVDGLSKMAAQAVSLRINMKDTLDFAERVFNPEGAIEMAAAMQRLGVAQSDLLDPLRLMDLSANDPTELQNQISQMARQFVQLNKDGRFEIMPGAKRQLREIEEAMKLPQGTLAKMAISSEELDMKMKKISFPSSIATEEDKKMIANMAEMGKSGNFEISFNDAKGNLVTKDVTKLSETDRDLLKKGFEPKTLEQLTKEQLSVQKDMAANMRAVAHQGGFGVAKSKVGQELYSTKRDISKGFADTFINESTSSKRIAEGINNTMGPVMDTFKDLIVGKKSPQQALDSLATAAKSAGNYLTTLGSDTMKAGKVAGQKMLMSDNQITQMIALVIKELVKTQEPSTPTTTTSGNDIVMKNQQIVLNPADTIFAGTGAEKIFEAVTKLTSSNNTGMVDNTPQNMNSTMDINFNLKLDSNQNIDMDQLERAFNSTALKEKIIEVATLGVQRFSPEASVRKKMNPYVSGMV